MEMLIPLFRLILLVRTCWSLTVQWDHYPEGILKLDTADIKDVDCMVYNLKALNGNFSLYCYNHINNIATYFDGYNKDGTTNRDGSMKNTLSTAVIKEQCGPCFDSFVCRFNRANGDTKESVKYNYTQIISDKSVFEPKRKTWLNESFVNVEVEFKAYSDFVEKCKTSLTSSQGTDEPIFSSIDGTSCSHKLTFNLPKSQLNGALSLEIDCKELNKNMTKRISELNLTPPSLIVKERNPNSEVQLVFSLYLCVHNEAEEIHWEIKDTKTNKTFCDGDRTEWNKTSCDQEIIFHCPKEEPNTNVTRKVIVIVTRKNNGLEETTTFSFDVEIPGNQILENKSASMVVCVIVVVVVGGLLLGVACLCKKYMPKRKAKTQESRIPEETNLFQTKQNC